VKLLSVDRSLEIFDKKSNELVAEYPIKLELEILSGIVKKIKNDELLYRQYNLSKRQTKILLTYLNLDLMIEMKSYRYFLACSGNYNWNDK